MTKDMYFEMCETLGSEPIESEIPVEISDFPEFVQQIVYIYYMLADRWDGMSGSYLGKDFSIIFNLFNIYALENAEQLLAIHIIQIIDRIRSEIIQTKISEQTPKTS